MFVLSTNQWRN